jgi:hypothetical protein
MVSEAEGVTTEPAGAVLAAVGAMGPASTAMESSTPSERESDDVGADAADARADCEPRLDEEPTLELRADADDPAMPLPELVGSWLATVGPASSAKKSSTPSESEADDAAADAADARAVEPRLEEEPALELRADAEAALARREDDLRTRGGIVEVSEGRLIT